MRQLFADALEGFLLEHPESMAVEDGQVIFDLREANYSLIDEGSRCLLQMWSDERSIVRRLLGCERKAEVLQLSVQSLGRPRPNRISLCPIRERLSPSLRRVQRERTLASLRRALSQNFVGWTLDSLRGGGANGSRLGAACLRGELRRGASRLAVVAFSECESQAAIDDSAASAILWLEECRRRAAARAVVEGCLVFLPPRRSLSARLRLGCLDKSLAQWRLFELDETTGCAEEVESLLGNLDLRLPRAAASSALEARFAASIARLRAMSPQIEFCVAGASELSFRLHGMEFARARLAPESSGFRIVEQIVFGLGREQRILSDENSEHLRMLVGRLEATRGGRDLTHPLCRAQPERWLESLLLPSLETLDPLLAGAPVYEQAPLLTRADRSILDLLAVNSEGRLVVIELKAAEDLCLPLQGLDYWTRVAELHRRGAFAREGYFAGRELSPEPPLLYLVAPCLHLHPELRAILRHLSPSVDWRLVGLDEHWRERLRVVLRRDRARLSES